MIFLVRAERCLLGSWVPTEISIYQVNTKRQEDGWGNFYNLSFNWFSDKFIEFFTRNLWGWNKCGEQECRARVGVFYFYIYLILFETFLAPDLCSQLLINSSYRRNHQKRLQTVWRQKLKLLAVIWFVTVLSPPSALTLFIPAFPPRVVSFAYKMMLVWLCLYCPPVPNINQFVATINLTSLKLLGNKYLGWRLSHLTTTGRIKPCWGMFQISFVVTTEYHWISIWYQ